jgi:hypothetical protein
MSIVHLKNLQTGGVTEEIDTESGVFRKLILQKFEGRPKWEEESVTDITGVLTRVLVCSVPALAAGVDQSIRLTSGIGKGGTITSAEYTPEAEITGAATNFRKLTIVNLDTATTHCTLAFESGTNAEAGVAKAFTVNSAAIVGGNAVEVLSKHEGTGIADPGGLVTVEVTYTA